MTLRSTFPNASDDFLRLNGQASTLSDDNLEAVKVAKPNKYHAERTGHYASKKEAAYAAELELRKKAGQVSFWLEQVPFILPGGVKHKLDFVVFVRCDSLNHRPLNWSWPYHVMFVEVKGRDLPMGKLKRKQVEDLYHIDIEVV